MMVTLDTTYFLSPGAVKDTYNLLADGIMKLMRALAAVDDLPVRQRAEAHGYERYVGSSVKGEAAIDWSSKRERRKLLAEVVADPMGCGNWPGTAAFRQSGGSGDS